MSVGYLRPGLAGTVPAVDAARPLHYASRGLRIEDGPYGSVWKRAFDVVAVAGLLVLLAPLFALIALLIRLDSPGPIVIRQERAGRDLRPFGMLKFRSMVKDADRHRDALLHL